MRKKHYTCKELAMVAEFHRTFEIPIRDVPTLKIPKKEALLRNRLIREEVNELCRAVKTGNFKEILDGLIDCQYILHGTAIAYGLGANIPAAFREVHRSNMSKAGADGKPLRRPDGKVIKGPNFSPPNLEPFLN